MGDVDSHVPVCPVCRKNSHGFGVCLQRFLDGGGDWVGCHCSNVACGDMSEVDWEDEEMGDEA